MGNQEDVTNIVLWHIWNGCLQTLAEMISFLEKIGWYFLQSIF